MGVNLALLAFGQPDLPDLTAPVNGNGAAVVAQLFPRTTFRPAGSASLMEIGIPDRNTVAVTRFAGGLLMATQDAALYNPTILHQRYRKPGLGRTVVLLTQRSVSDMFAFARWRDGTISRSISVNPIGRVWESIGAPEDWERPFWDGLRPVEPGYPLPFHPLDMSDAALRGVLGLWCEGDSAAGLVSVDHMVMEVFQR